MRKLLFEELFKDEKCLNNWRIREGDNWHNGELQAYRKSQLSFDPLVIKGEVKKTGSREFVSARLDTFSKFEFKYGLIEVVAKLPKSVGAWPAIWLLATDVDVVGWPECGEIDIMESVGHKKNEIFFSVHTKQRNFMNKKGFTKTNSYQGIYSDYHKYSLEWNNNSLKWFFDGSLAFEVNKNSFLEEDWVFDKNYYLILNMAIGGNFTENKLNIEDFPAKFKVKSVRVWGLDEN